MGVPAGVAAAVLTGPAAQLAGLLDPAFLAEAGWDPTVRVLSLPAQHPLLGRTLCRVEGCAATAHGTKTGGLCWRCYARLTGAGMTVEEIITTGELPALAARPVGCLVPGCQRILRGGDPGSGPGCAPRIPAGSAAPRRYRSSSSSPTRSCGRYPRWGPAPWRPALDGPRANTATAPPTTSGGATRSPPTPQPTSGTGTGTAGGVRRRAGQPAGAGPAGGPRGAVWPAAAHPWRSQAHRCESAGGR